VIDMASEHYDARGASRVGAGAEGTTGGEPSLGELLRRLTTDTGELVRQEVSLAKVEIRQTGATLARDGTRIGIALGLALAGALALVAFLVLALGDMLDNYWLAALIVGLVFVGIGYVLAKRALDDVKRRGLAPQQTIATLREDAAWAKQETREVKRELTT
jgi:uncharacterized membrane protein YqjE